MMWFLVAVRWLWGFGGPQPEQHYYYYSSSSSGGGGGGGVGGGSGSGSSSSSSSGAGGGRLVVSASSSAAPAVVDDDTHHPEPPLLLDGSSLGGGSLRRPEASAPCSGLLFVTFRDDLLERDWWQHAKARELRRPEVLVLATFLCFSTMHAWLAFCSGLFSIASAAFATHVVQAGLSAVVLVLAVGAKPFYERYHDWLMLAMRAAVFPSAFFASCGSPPPKTPFRAVIFLLVAFGHIRCVLDAFRFPLRFRHHVVVQTCFVAAWGFWNWWLCGKCLKSTLVEEAVFGMCRWVGFASTGVMVDCEEIGFELACLTAALQLNVLIGLILTSTIVYRMEMDSRMRFVEDHAKQD